MSEISRMNKWQRITATREAVRNIKPGDKVLAIHKKETKEFTVESVSRNEFRTIDGTRFSTSGHECRSFAVRYSVVDVIKSPVSDNLNQAESALNQILETDLPDDVKQSIINAKETIKGKRV